MKTPEAMRNLLNKQLVLALSKAGDQYLWFLGYCFHQIFDIKHQLDTVLVMFEECFFIQAKMTKSSQKSVKIVYLFLEFTYSEMQRKTNNLSI